MTKQQKQKVQVNALEQINSNAAGIDIGSEEMYVAVPPGRDEESVRCFPTFTADLHRLADWLKSCKIDTVAMESTGVCQARNKMSTKSRSEMSLFSRW